VDPERERLARELARDDLQHARVHDPIEKRASSADARALDAVYNRSKRQVPRHTRSLALDNWVGCDNS